MKVRSFPPLAAADARVLILGSMPGAASLKARQYYAHPHNQFWKIMDPLFGAGPQLPYATRVRRLTAQGVAVWDVLACCVRPGSLDASIVRGSEIANDFAGFFRAHRRIKAVFFNGAAAAAAFRRLILLHQPLPEGLRLERLPSTSPAHAGRSLRHKLREWQRVREALS